MALENAAAGEPRPIMRFGRRAAISVGVVLAGAIGLFAFVVRLPDPLGPPQASTAPSSSSSSQVATSTTIPATTTTTIALPVGRLIERQIGVFPGPDVFEGDVISLTVSLGDFADHSLGEVALSVDGRPQTVEASIVSDPLLGSHLYVPDALDTAGMVGTHVIEIEALIDGEDLARRDRVVVDTASRRQTQEAGEWTLAVTGCCEIGYWDGSAADRDLEELVGIVDESARVVADRFSTPVEQMNIALIDILWGNGGYSNGEQLVMSYLDRDFGPTTDGTVDMTFVHEITHGVADRLGGNPPWPLSEAIAVYVNGGHYKPEDLPARAKALSELGGLLPLGEFLDTFADLQHESRYVEAGALAEYLVETYGWDSYVALYALELEIATPSEWFDEAAGVAFGDDLEAISTGFEAWVESHESGDELIDLRLMVDLQTARRRYQALYSPYPSVLPYDSVATWGPALSLREAREPVRAAVETYIAYAQRLLFSGRYEEAADVVGEIEEIVASGTVDRPGASAFLAVALALDGDGFELLSLELENGVGIAETTEGHPKITTFAVTLVGGAVTLREVVPVAR